MKTDKELLLAAKTLVSHLHPLPDKCTFCNTEEHEDDAKYCPVLFLENAIKKVEDR